MSIGELSEQILMWIPIYGPLTVSLALFLGALGLPLPGTLFVIAGGAFMRLGVLDSAWTPAAALLGVVTGDMLSYAVGRMARRGLQGRMRGWPAWRRAEAELQRRGGSVIYLSRWLLTPLAIPTNFISGGSGYPARRFLLFDALGEATWLLAFGGLGYVAGSQWETLSAAAADAGVYLAAIAVIASGFYLAQRCQVWKPRPQRFGARRVPVQSLTILT